MNPASGAGETLFPPVVLDGKYRLEAKLGEGTSGTVFRALHLDLRRTFALKLLKPRGRDDARCLARFRQEAEALGRLRHPRIVEVTDFGVDDATGTAYLVLEHLEGRSLAQELGERGPLPLGRALLLLQAIAEAVDAAHAHGILHRDLKPANVFLPSGAPRGTKILDFGLAELVEPRAHAGSTAGADADLDPGGDLTATGALPGTPLYVAPEVIRDGSTSRASDLYSLGVLAYEMLAGRPPFRGSAQAVLEAHLERLPPPIPGLAPGVFDALLELLHKDPQRRPATAGAAVRGLRRAARKAALDAFKKTEIPRRLKWSACWAACLLAAAVWLPPSLLPELDRRFYDAAVRIAPARPADPRLLLVTIDQQSLEAKGLPWVDTAWADDVGRAIPGLFAAGARGVALDMLLPKAWSESKPFAVAVLRHGDGLTLAAHSDPRERRIQGVEGLSPLVVAALGTDRASALFGFTNVDEEPDDVIRSGRVAYPLAGGGLRPSWAVLAGRHLDAPPRLGESFRIDHRIDWRPGRLPRLPWRDLPAALARRPGLFAGRLVLIGGGALVPRRDEHFVPGRKRRERITGLELQALMLSSLTANPPLREAEGRALPLATALAAGLGATGLLCARRQVAGLAALAALVPLLAGAALALLYSASLIVFVSTPLVLIAGGAVAALSTRLFLPPFPHGGLS